MLDQRLQEHGHAGHDGRLMVAKELPIYLLFARAQPPHLHWIPRPAQHLLDDLYNNRKLSPLLLIMVYYHLSTRLRDVSWAWTQPMVAEYGTSSPVKNCTLSNDRQNMEFAALRKSS